MSKDVPFSERVNMFSIHPDAADRHDVAEMAAHIQEQAEQITFLENNLLLKTTAMEHLKVKIKCLTTEIKEHRINCEGCTVSVDKIKEENIQLRTAMESIIDHEEYWNLLKDIGVIAEKALKG